jgi:hypothetical protein
MTANNKFFGMLKQDYRTDQTALPAQNALPFKPLNGFGLFGVRKS